MSDRVSDRNRIRGLVKTLRDATVAKEGESETAVSHCWDFLSSLVEVEKEDEES